jgi:aminoglycoside phosphotransferase (APT) family kinase protein
VTSALPRVGVVGAGPLTEGASGRYDSAVAELDDGRRVVVRAPVAASAVAELAAESRALRALTPGVRALLPFRAPELLGEAGVGDARAIVVDFLPGYRVDASHVPPGRGAATSVGEALAALHALPLSIVRIEGLPVRTPQQVRDDVRRLVERADATGGVPESLTTRWRRAVAVDRLWRFESSIVLGGAGAASFLFEDVDGLPHVTGVLDWHGLSVGDPSTDLKWLASAPLAADDVYTAYAAHTSRAPDALLRERARLYAELEFASWLLHGHEVGSGEIVDDATGLLASLADSVRSDDLVPDSGTDLDDAIALIGRVPEQPAPVRDTSMQTDAYDPEELSLWVDDDRADDPEATEVTPAEPAPFAADDATTAPIDISPLLRRGEDDESDAAAEAERASEAALRRWTGTRD